ncbi:hypothetical protein KCP77_20950 [Salmonella enterica subsp. enterica]|nr:hypothetical protein KCP77_20950 [Salmonella enterica subsp. enterica]
MPIANAAEKLPGQRYVLKGTYFRAGHVPDGMISAKLGDLSRQSQRNGYGAMSKAGNTPTVLLLAGQQDPRHHIQVRTRVRGGNQIQCEWSWRHLECTADNASFRCGR